ncbi:MAG: DUF1501 domain-containing protein [Planctomycetaceae bacterium]|nr:DUF1501 domain-containing protein [Planctomycetaceae bacterium]
MLEFSSRTSQHCNGVSRRDILRLGAAGGSLLTLPNLLRAREHTGRSGKSVILIHMAGGPSQLDSYDLKPDAPVEYRSTFRPIATSVPGVEISELLPRQAQMMDQLAIIRDLQFHNELPFDHDPHEVFSGYPPKYRRPPLGAIVSRVQPPVARALPPYVSLCQHRASITERLHPEDPLYAGTGHRPFAPISRDLENLQVELPAKRLADRAELLRRLDGIRREIDQRGDMRAMDEFTSRALAMVTSPEVLSALDITREPAEVLARYGPDREYYPLSFPGRKPDMWLTTKFLVARRLVEAGVPVVTMNIGSWDHHGVLSNGPQSGIFPRIQQELPWFDQAFAALVTDLKERGLLNDVLVVAWGEMGRTPKINRQAGRDHWQNSGFALLAGGGLKTGQAIGATDRLAAHPLGNPHTPEHVFATIYRHLGINPSQAIPDFTGRPRHLLDDTEPIRELL